MRTSVVIRALDEVASIGRTLELLAAQREPHEVIVVDSGSRDGTIAVARSAGAAVIEIDPARFTFGRALNTGCAQARGEVIVALSAHAFPPDPGWLTRMADALAGERVACACGWQRGPGGEPLEAALTQTADDARANPFYGYTNGAGAFRAELWRELPFDESLPGTEDRAWAWHWLERGWHVLIDPALAVEHDHSRDGLLDTYRREVRELRGYASFLELDRWPPRELARRWWSEEGWHRSPWRARLDPRRAVRLAGAYRVRREVGR